jgi:hypothetical protein
MCALMDVDEAKQIDMDAMDARVDEVKALFTAEGNNHRRCRRRRRPLHKTRFFFSFQLSAMARETRTLHVYARFMFPSSVEG